MKLKNTQLRSLSGIFFLAFQLCNLTTLFAQGPVTLCLGQDATVCPGQAVVLNDCNNIGGGVGGGTNVGPYTVLGIPYTPDPFNAGTSITLSDDAVSGVQPIGFNFCFFGNTYTQFYIGSNGWISFSAGQTNLWTNSPIPSTNANVPKNCIMSPWQDWYPPAGGTIKYQVYGTAPSRRLVVSWNAIPMFSCNANLGTFQIKIFETTNVIETHILNKPSCTQWAGGLSTHGLHNINGTIGVVVPGRNSSVWTASNEGYRFSPGIVWQNSLGQSFPYNGGTLNINPVPSGTTGYWLSGGCGTGGGLAISDTTWITRATPSVTTIATPDVCSQGIGSITANPGVGSPAPHTFTWNPGALIGNAINNLFAGTYTVTQIDGNGCSATASLVVGDTPASFSANTTLVSCPGGSDAIATAIIIPASNTTTYQWSNGQTTQTITGLSAGSYWCFVNNNAGCSDTIYVTISEIPAMALNPINVIDANCYTIANGQATINVTLGTAPYTYDWDISASLSGTALDLGAGMHTCTVTDANGCVQTISVNINQPSPLDITFLTQDTMICSESSILLSAIGAGGSTAYTYSWTENGIAIGNGGSITVDPINSGTGYCVTLSEACGSPITTECMTIIFPLEIIPVITAVDNQICTPGDFQHHNASSNGQDIASTSYVFSNGDSYTVPNQDDLFHTIVQPGVYDLSVVITSIHGCIYNGFFDDHITVTDNPTANFTISKNPITWFETTVQTNDISLGNIAQYNWSSPGSTNIISTGSSAMITYPEGIMASYPIMLTVTTVDGCSDSITIDIDVVADIIFYAPTAFTPDDDEHNQVWAFYVEGIDFENFHLEIYNRWGEVIWETYDTKGYWDGYFNGVKVQPGTYTWKAWYKDKDTDSKTVKSGMIHVIR
jgi:gliding motility-associated-like protein